MQSLSSHNRVLQYLKNACRQNLPKPKAKREDLVQTVVLNIPLSTEQNIKQEQQTKETTGGMKKSEIQSPVVFFVLSIILQGTFYSLVKANFRLPA